MVLLLLLMLGCREALVHDLDEASANRLQLLLRAAGIDAVKSRDGNGWSIEVDPDELTPALEVVASSRVMRQPAQAAPQGEISMLMSREERAEVLARNSASALERTIEGLPEVLEARVHVGGSKRESASVVVVTRGEVAGAIDEIRAIAAASLGMLPEQIRVVRRMEPPFRPVSRKPRPSYYPEVAAVGAVLLGVLLLQRRRAKTVDVRPLPIETVEVADAF